MSAVSGLEITEPSIFERGSEGRTGMEVPDPGHERPAIPESLLRKDAARLPSVSEVEVVRHFTRLSRMNYGIDVGFYPLGSCTMKYNPRVNEDVAAMAGFAGIHPYLPEGMAQGALEAMWELASVLAEVTGLPGVSLAPAAGAHGELTGMRVIRKALEARGDPRKKVLIPDTAHGTNPASCVLSGYKAVEVKSSGEGILDPAEVAGAVDEDVAAIMITNPNTLGLFEESLPEVARLVHEKGGLVYGDGANLNAIMGKARPATLGIDVMQLNLHKTFSTPHGGGGPGSGPVCVTGDLDPFLPVPRVVKRVDGSFGLDEALPESIGRVRTFAGQFAVIVKALAYVKALGGTGLRDVAEMAVLNSNYVRARLKGRFELPFTRPSMHEAVFSDHVQSAGGVHTMDIAKALMDRGFHPPTVYFPLIVHGAIMIEPTETEDKATLDEFVDAMIAIADEVDGDPERLLASPHLTSVSRPDEVQAARKPVLTWQGD